MQRDINFFSTYVLKNQSEKRRSIFRYGYLGVIGAGIAGTFLFNQFELLHLKQSIQEVEDLLAAPPIANQIAESDFAFQMLEVLKSYDEQLTPLVKGIQSRDLITKVLLDQISATLPSGVSLGSLNITDGSVTMQATSDSRPSVAEFQHNLKQLPFIVDVYVGGISEQAPYTISVTCTVKGDQQYED